MNDVMSFPGCNRLSEKMICGPVVVLRSLEKCLSMQHPQYGHENTTAAIQQNGVY